MATPGEANDVAGAPPASQPRADLASGIYNGTQTVSLSTPTPNATIRYTVDGTKPSASSPIVAGPITVAAVEGAVTIRAVAFAPQRAPSPEASFSYVFPDATLTEFPGAAAYIPNLPILVINDANADEGTAHRRRSRGVSTSSTLTGPDAQRTPPPGR